MSGRTGILMAMASILGAAPAQRVSASKLSGVRGDGIRVVTSVWRGTSPADYGQSHHCQKMRRKNKLTRLGIGGDKR